MAEATVETVLLRAAELVENAPLLAKGLFDAHHSDLDPATGRRRSFFTAGSDSDCFCTSGAIIWAAFDITGGHPFVYASAGNANDAVRQELGQLNIFDWNDAPERTKQEVVDVLRAAADRAVQEPAGQ